MLIRMDIEAGDAVVIDDALSGVESAKAAGLDVIAVNNEHLAGLSEYAGSLENLYRALDPEDCIK